MKPRERVTARASILKDGQPYDTRLMRVDIKDHQKVADKAANLLVFYKRLFDQTGEPGLRWSIVIADIITGNLVQRFQYVGRGPILIESY